MIARIRRSNGRKTPASKNPIPTFRIHHKLVSESLLPANMSARSSWKLLGLEEEY